MKKGMMETIFASGMATGTAVIRLLPPELSHAIGMKLVGAPLLWDLAADWLRHKPKFDLSCDVPGIGKLQHPIGLAAGFDKDCDCPVGFCKLGFSFVEIGTVTPLPQPGNPRPRLFRIRDELSLVNRMGFNGIGMEKVSKRLRSMNWDHSLAPLGVNLGKNKLTKEADALRDYLTLIETFSSLARYLVVNISSPNTPGLRGFANDAFVRELLQTLTPEQRSKTWFKLDPDLPRDTFQSVVRALVDQKAAGVVLTNTHRVEQPHAGGQSGHPLSIASTARLEWAWDVHRGALPMVGAGGIFSGADVFQKLIRGASAVQIYTALVYGGPLTIKRILSELEWELELAGFASVRECVGSFYTGRFGKD